MAALSANRLTNISGSFRTVSKPVKASTTIYKGGLVAIDSTGYAVPAADTAGHKVIGVALEKIDNSAGASGALNVLVANDCRVQLSAASIAITSDGAVMYVVDDQTFDEAVGTNSIKVGVLDGYISATEGFVYIYPTPAAV